MSSAARTSRPLLAAAGLLLLLAGPAIFLAGFRHPFVSAHPTVTFPLTAVGSLLVMANMISRRTRGAVAMGVAALLLTGLHGFAVTAMIAVPRDPAALGVGSKMPPFSLTSASGETVTLDTILADGPAVVVFFRGSW